MANLHNIDYLVSTEKQAQLLRDRKFEQLDLENLIEEVEDLGKSELRACKSWAMLIIIHLLYLRYWKTELELSPLELAKLRDWFAKFDAAAWDKQFEEDVVAGRLDELAKKALENLQAGNCTDL